MMQDPLHDQRRPNVKENLATLAPFPIGIWALPSRPRRSVPRIVCLRSCNGWCYDAGGIVRSWPSIWAHAIARGSYGWRARSSFPSGFERTSIS
jgi:hypothetical protein